MREFFQKFLLLYFAGKNFNLLIGPNIMQNSQKKAKTSTLEPKFKPGDKVRYVSPKGFGEKNGYYWLNNQIGTIIKTNSFATEVKFNKIRGSEKWVVYSDNLEKIEEEKLVPKTPEPEFKVGDRVKHIGSYTPNLIGETGTVKVAFSDSCYIAFSPETSRLISNDRLEKINPERQFPKFKRGDLVTWTLKHYPDEKQIGHIRCGTGIDNPKEYLVQFS